MQTEQTLMPPNLFRALRTLEANNPQARLALLEQAWEQMFSKEPPPAPLLVQTLLIQFGDELHQTAMMQMELADLQGRH